MARIGVETALSEVKQGLTEMGHEVVDLRSESDAENCDCCIITGEDKNVMGMADVAIEGPVINAQGQSADEVINMVSERIE